MAAIRICIQFLDIPHNSGTTGFTLLNRVPSVKFNRVKVAHKLLEVRIFLTHDGFVSILKKLAVASVAAVKAHRVSRKEPSHYRGKGNESCSKEERNDLG